MFWAIVFMGVVGASPVDMKPMVSMGPFSTFKECVGIAALAIGSTGGLNDKHPDKDFRVSCSMKPGIERNPNEQLYDLQMLMNLFEKER